jgi:PhzF family phenazine biosynthesis protein
MTRRIPLYQLDAFAERLFTGNPAAVCPLERWLPDEVMQAIGAENNLAETAFFVRDDSGTADFHLRWFTPTVEIELCGHATLASGWVLVHELGWSKPSISFRTLGGRLVIERRGDDLWLALPTRKPPPVAAPAELLKGLGLPAATVLGSGNKLMVVMDSAEQVRQLQPDMAALRQLSGKGVIVSAQGADPGTDFVSRFFAPAMGIDEDPVTGSAHCLLVPYWAERLGRTELRAAQLSSRGGRLLCRLDGAQVWLSGPVQPYLKGEMTV